MRESSQHVHFSAISTTGENIANASISNFQILLENSPYSFLLALTLSGVDLP